MTAESTTPLSPAREAEIRETHPGDWYAGPWVQDSVEPEGGDPGYWRVSHEESGTTLATLPDFAGPIALFLADAHDAVPELLAETDRLRADLADARSALDRVRFLHARDDDADYCVVCSNHGDIDWPCRTVAAIDNTPYHCSLHGSSCDGDLTQAHIMQPAGAEQGERPALDPRSFDRPGQRAAARMLNADDTEAGGR